jgi:hypothetical protein
MPQKMKWLPKPENHDYQAAEDYLSLIMPAKKAAEWRQKLSAAQDQIIRYPLHPGLATEPRSAALRRARRAKRRRAARRPAGRGPGSVAPGARRPGPR